MIREDIIDLFRVPVGKKVRLKDSNPGWKQSDEFEEFGKETLKERAKQVLDQNLIDLATAQDLLAAADRYSLLIVLKFVLNVSKDEQKWRFLERLDRSEKNWKFSPADLAERGYWDDYMNTSEDALAATSTASAPWYVVPADNKWVTRAVVADIVTTAIRGRDLRYPDVTAEKRKLLEDARRRLDAE